VKNAAQPTQAGCGKVRKMGVLALVKDLVLLGTAVSSLVAERC
jgi:hypothetical protein